MTDFALSAKIITDNSKSTIKTTNFVRAYTAKSLIDNSKTNILDTNLVIGLRSFTPIDKSKTKIDPRYIRAFVGKVYVDKSKTKATAAKVSAFKTKIFTDNSKTKIKSGVLRSHKGTILVDKSNTSLNVGFTRSLKSTIYTDKSKSRIIYVERLFLTEPPVGKMFVVVNGIDRPLSGFNFDKDSTYAINFQIESERLSTAGTELEFIVKRSIDDNKDDAYIFASTLNEKIYIKSVVPIVGTNYKQMNGQISLRQNDMYKLPSSIRAVKLYYQILLKDSLNEQYPIENGMFIVNKAIN